MSDLSERSAVVIGTISLDLVAESKSATVARAAVGNSAANIAIRLAGLGWDVELISLIGPDRAGELVTADLERWGVGTRGVIARAGYRTPRVFQVATGTDFGSVAILMTCPRCGRPRGHRLAVPELAELSSATLASAQRASLVVSDVAGATAMSLFNMTSGLTWYEASLREASTEDLAATSALAAAVKCSQEEADFYAAALAGTGKANRLRVITRGERGADSSWRRAGESWSTWHNSPSALHRAPVDTIGAGDAFTAAMLHVLATPAGLEDDATVRSAAQLGSEHAAAACLARGARGDMVIGEDGDSSSAWITESAPFECGLCEQRS